VTTPAASADEALRTLRRPGPASVRREAAAQLVEAARLSDDPAPWEERGRALLGDADAEVRRAGVALLALVGGPPEQLLERIGPGLADRSASVRMEAVGQLADAARAELRPVLAAALGDQAFLVRFEAARGLAALHHPAGLDVLAEGLGQSALRFRAIGALAQLGDPRALGPLRRLFRRWFLDPFERTQAAGALASLGDGDGARHLLARLERRRALDRPLAVELCGEAHLTLAEAALLAILEDRTDRAWGAAARALGRLGTERAGPSLEEALADGSVPEEMRLDAAEGLVFLRGAGAREPLAAALGGLAAEESRAELRSLLEELG